MEATFGVKGRQIPPYCKQHYNGMSVKVIVDRCFQSPCVRLEWNSVDANNTPSYCKQHAEDGMVTAW